MLDILKKAVNLALKQGASQAEAIGTTTITRSVDIEKWEVKQATTKRSGGIGVRVVVDGRIGFASAENTSRESLEDVVKRALDVAKARGPLPGFKSLPEPSQIPKVEGIYCDWTASLSLDMLIKEAQETINLVTDLDSRVKTISGGLGLSIWETGIVNSLGVEGLQKGTAAALSIFAVAEEAGVQTSGFEFQRERSFKKIDLDHVAKGAVKSAIAQLKPSKINAGDYEVLLDPIAVSMLLSTTFARAICADNVQDKRSFLTGKLGQEIATPSLTIVDDALIPGGLSSRRFDGEGVPSQRLTVVDKGILASYLYNTYTAQREGRDSTGHAARNYSSEPSVAPTNLVLKTREVKRKERLLDEVEKGLLIRWVIGAHTANPITGEFSVALGEAYYVEKGEIKFPVKQAMAGGNVQQLLKDIDCAGDDVRNMPPFITGTLRIHKLKISA